MHVEGEVAGVRGSSADRDLHPNLLKVFPAHPEGAVVVAVVLVANSGLARNKQTENIVSYMTDGIGGETSSAVWSVVWYGIG